MQEIIQVLTTFGNRRYATRKEFLNQMLSTLRRAFFPMWDLVCIHLLIQWEALHFSLARRTKTATDLNSI